MFQPVPGHLKHLEMEVKTAVFNGSKKTSSSWGHDEKHLLTSIAAPLMGLSSAHLSERLEERLQYKLLPLKRNKIYLAKIFYVLRQAGVDGSQ